MFGQSDVSSDSHQQEQAMKVLIPALKKKKRAYRCLEHHFSIVTDSKRPLSRSQLEEITHRPDQELKYISIEAMTEVDRGECVHAERPEYQSKDEGDSKVSISTDSGKKIAWKDRPEEKRPRPGACSQASSIVFFVLGNKVVTFSPQIQWLPMLLGAERWEGGTAMRVDPPHG